jgi:hypothetical protein
MVTSNQKQLKGNTMNKKQLAELAFQNAMSAFTGEIQVIAPKMKIVIPSNLPTANTAYYSI